MPTSQNGFPSNNRSLIHNPKVPGTTISFPGGIRKGAVTTVLLYVAVQWHRRIEPLTPGHNWGYAERAIRGSTQTSNHASGTATDANAPKHPLGVRGTFTAAQIRELRAIERECEGVVRFGEFYSGRVDGMHAEINAPLARVEQVAAKLLNPAMAPNPNVPEAPTRRRKVIEMRERINPGKFQDGRFTGPFAGPSATIEKAWVTASNGVAMTLEVWCERAGGGDKKIGMTNGYKKQRVMSGDRFLLPVPDGADWVYYQATSIEGAGDIVIDVRARA